VLTGRCIEIHIEILRISEGTTQDKDKTAMHKHKRKEMMGRNAWVKEV
jgi:glycerol-3-phosphate cytidylyltransferase-like family protein